MPAYYLAVFDSTHYALSFEKAVKEKGFKISVMPVPREISASCGLAVKIESADTDEVKRFAELSSLKVAAYYRAELQNGHKTYHKSI